MNGPLRMLIVSEPGVDGVFRYVENLIAYLHGCGHHVDLAYSSVRSSDRLYLLVEKVAAQGGQTLDLRTNNAPALKDVLALASLSAFIGRRRPDIIHAHSSKAGALSRALPLAWRTPIIYTPHGYYGLKLAAGPVATFYNLIERLLARRGLTINVSASESVFATRVLGVPASRHRVIYNGVDIGRFRPPSPEERRAAREHFGLPQDKLVLGSLARLSAQKDPQTLYRACGLAHAAGLDLHLLHVGTGGDTSYAQSLIDTCGIRQCTTRVEYLSDATPFYHAIDGLILTSRYEGFSLVALEALASGLPLVLTAVVGNSDILELPLSQVWSCVAGDENSVQKAIEQWAEAMHQTRENNHRALAVSGFDQVNHYRQVAQAYADARARNSF